MRYPDELSERDPKYCGTSASITDVEKVLVNKGGIKHPVKIINELHDNPEKFKEFLPEFEPYVGLVKSSKVKTPRSVTIAFKAYEYAILHVLAEKYNTSMSKIGRALVIYSIHRKGLDS